ncbi:MAG TPA: hypothetical protein VKD23_10810 [Terriglobales bacterium]|nr:hypothetical protein [Terriglobales bacterium]
MTPQPARALIGKDSAGNERTKVAGKVHRLRFIGNWGCRRAGRQRQVIRITGVSHDVGPGDTPQCRANLL